VSWGAHTVEGAGRQAIGLKYVHVRRTALYIEESLYHGSMQVVFEPNDEPLWSQVRLHRASTSVRRRTLIAPRRISQHVASPRHGGGGHYGPRVYTLSSRRNTWMLTTRRQLGRMLRVST